MSGSGKQITKVPAGIHKQFAKLCTHRTFRTQRKAPKDLSGLAMGDDVIQDEFGNDFYISTAMHWISEQLENDVILEAIEMRQPDAWFQTETTGATLYQFTAPVSEGGQLVYVKIQHVRNKLVLWSFHKSDRPIH